MARQPVAVGHAAEPVRNTTLDLAHMSVRDVNRLLHAASQGDFLIKNPRGLPLPAAPFYTRSHGASRPVIERRRERAGQRFQG